MFSVKTAANPWLASRQLPISGSHEKQLPIRGQQQNSCKSEVRIKTAANLRLATKQLSIRGYSVRTAVNQWLASKQLPFVFSVITAANQQQGSKTAKKSHWDLKQFSIRSKNSCRSEVSCSIL